MAQISVVIPVYNCEKYIAQGIESVINQSFSDWELLLVNDGSTDNSREICRRYEQEDERIHLIDKENGGGGGEARNVGMSNASSPYLAFLDSDDYYEPDMLKTLFEAQQKEDYDVVIAGFQEFADGEDFLYQEKFPESEYRSEKEVRDFFVDHYPEGMLGYPWNKLYKTSIIRKYNLKFPKMRRLEDGIFNVEYFEKCSSCRVLDYIGHNYRASRQTELGKLPYDFYDIMEVFAKQYLTTLKEWGYTDTGNEQPMADYFQNDLVCCVENIWQPVWLYDKRKKMRDIKAIREKELTDYMLHKPCTTGKYTQIATILYRNNCYRLLHLVIEVKFFIKLKFNHVFYKLKEKVN